MKPFLRSALVGSLFLAALASCHTASADVIVNGAFSDGLTGWTVEVDNTPDSAMISGGTATANDSGDIIVNVSGGDATISQDSLSLEVDLYQVFTVPTLPTTLQFTLTGITPGSFGTPAGLNVSLVDPSTNLPLVPTFDATTDSYFTHDLTAGASGKAGSGVTVTPSLDSDPPLTITLDTSGLTSDTSAEILFRLLGGDDLAANVSISNVVFNAGPNGGGGGGAVPEPGTFGMLLAGMTGLVWLKRRRAHDIALGAASGSGPIQTIRPECQ